MLDDRLRGRLEPEMEQMEELTRGLLGRRRHVRTDMAALLRHSHGTRSGCRDRWGGLPSPSDAAARSISAAEDGVLSRPHATRTHVVIPPAADPRGETVHGGPLTVEGAVRGRAPFQATGPGIGGDAWYVIGKGRERTPLRAARSTHHGPRDRADAVLPVPGKATASPRSCAC